MKETFHISKVLVAGAQKWTNKPKTILILAILIFLPALAATTQLKLDNDPRKLAPTDIERDVANTEFESVFGADDTKLLLILSGQNASTLLKSLVTINTALEKESKIVSVISAAGITIEVQDESGSLIEVSPFAGESALGEDPEAQIQAIREWSGSSTLISDDGTHVIMVIELDDALRDPVKAMFYMDELEERIKAALPTDIKSHIGGLAATRAASVKSIMTDAMLLFPLSGLIVLLVTLWRFRSLRYTMVLMSVLTWSVGITAGGAAIMGFPLTPLSQLFPILLMIIGVADGVHLIEALGRAKGSIVDRWKSALAQTGHACFLTSLTTAIGFLALLFTRLPVLHEFALIVSFGIGIALISNIFVLPAACLTFCPNPPKLSTSSSYWFGRFALHSYRHGRIYTLAGATFLLVCLYFCTQIKVDYYLSRVLDSENPISQGNHLLYEHFGGSIPIEASIHTHQGDFNDPENLKALDALSHFLAEHTSYVSSHSQALKTTRKLLTGEDGLPTDRQSAEELTSVYQELVSTPLLSNELDHARIAAITPDLGAKALLDLQDEFNKMSDSMPNIEAQMVGSMIGAAEGFETLVYELLIGLLGALSLVIVLIGINLRSLKMAIISVIPNSLPILVGVAFFPASGQHLDIFSAVFFTIALGIAVDDTIHMLKHFQHLQSDGGAIDDNIQRTGSEVGSALANTSWILISGFAVLLLSDFPANRTSGGLVAALIGTAFISDLLFVPAGIALFKWRKKT